MPRAWPCVRTVVQRVLRAGKHMTCEVMSVCDHHIVGGGTSDNLREAYLAPSGVRRVGSRISGLWLPAPARRGVYMLIRAVVPSPFGLVLGLRGSIEPENFFAISAVEVRMTVMPVVSFL